MGVGISRKNNLKPYRFKLSLRLRHPRLEADEITKLLRMEPRTKWSVGEPRRRTDGTATEGVNDHTYWTYNVPNTETGLVDALNAHLTELESRSDFLRECVATGGEIEYFVGWFTTDVSGGDTLDWQLFKRLSELKINLALDVYGNA